MKKTILFIFCICNLNFEAKAVVLFLARTKDPKKAEEIWISNEKANRVFLEKRRNELKKKHAFKKEQLVVVSAEKIILSEQNLKTKSLLSTPASTEGDGSVQERIELKTD